MSEFVWNPTYGSAVSTKPNIKPVQFGDGYEQRVPMGINSDARRWEVIFGNRPTATADAIAAFLKAAGARQSFNWTPPHGVRFPRYFVCQRVDFMLPVFPDAVC